MEDTGQIKGFLIVAGMVLIGIAAGMLGVWGARRPRQGPSAKKSDAESPKFVSTSNWLRLTNKELRLQDIGLVTSGIILVGMILLEMTDGLSGFLIGFGLCLAGFLAKDLLLRPKQQRLRSLWKRAQMPPEEVTPQLRQASRVMEHASDLFAKGGVHKPEIFCSDDGFSVTVLVDKDSISRQLYLALKEAGVKHAVRVEFERPSE